MMKNISEKNWIMGAWILLAVVGLVTIILSIFLFGDRKLFSAEIKIIDIIPDDDEEEFKTPGKSCSPSDFDCGSGECSTSCCTESCGFGERCCCFSDFGDECYVNEDCIAVGSDGGQACCDNGQCGVCTGNCENENPDNWVCESGGGIPHDPTPDTECAGNNDCTGALKCCGPWGEQGVCKESCDEDPIIDPEDTRVA